MMPTASCWLGRVALLVVLPVAGCVDSGGNDSAAAPFRDLAIVVLDGQTRQLGADVVSLGNLVEDDVIRLRIDGPIVETVLLLTDDLVTGDAAVVVGGGPPGEAFDYRVRIPGPYYVFIQLDASMVSEDQRISITAELVDSPFRPPVQQVVEVRFEEGYLTEPGLLDPTSGSAADRDLLIALSEAVRIEILARLRAIFTDTPIVIVEPHEPRPAGPMSRLTFVADRIEAEDQTLIDAALPPPDPSRPECQVRVLFGEVLPRGVRQDVGNRVLDDEAVVYVGSFQGRGESCRTAVTDSINNIVLSLAQTGAHEIGHLVGLLHVEQVDIMNRSATLAFQRELALDRGQVQIERALDGSITTDVLTAVIQSPQLYFRANFSR